MIKNTEDPEAVPIATVVPPDPIIPIATIVPPQAPPPPQEEVQQSQTILTWFKTRERPGWIVLSAIAVLLAFVLAIYSLTIVGGVAPKEEIKCDDDMVQWMIVFGIIHLIISITSAINLIAYENDTKKMPVGTSAVVHVINGCSFGWNFYGMYLSYGDKKESFKVCDSDLHFSLQMVVTIQFVWICVVCVAICFGVDKYEDE